MSEDPVGPAGSERDDEEQRVAIAKARADMDAGESLIEEGEVAAHDRVVARAQAWALIAIAERLGSIERRVGGVTARLRSVEQEIARAARRSR